MHIRDPNHRYWHDGEPTLEELIQHWSSLAIRISIVMARTYGLSAEDREDIVSAIHLALCRIPAPKRAWSGYVAMAIKNAARAELSRIKGHGGGGTQNMRWQEYDTAGYVDYVSSERADDMYALDKLLGADSGEEALLSRIHLDELLSRLSESERQCVLLYRQGYTQMEIASELGYSTEWVRQRLKRAISRLVMMSR